MRKLATVRKIDKIEPIEGADKIVKATVGGWSLVTAIDNGFKEGDLVVYLEIDSWVPTEIAPFLSKGKEPRVYKGVKGERLRTVKLRGVQSQGLIIKLTDMGDIQTINGKKMLRINKTYSKSARAEDGYLSNFQQDNK